MIIRLNTNPQLLHAIVNMPLLYPNFIFNRERESKRERRITLPNKSCAFLFQLRRLHHLTHRLSTKIILVRLKGYSTF